MYAAMDESLRASAWSTYAVCATRKAGFCGWAMLTNLSDDHIVGWGVDGDKPWCSGETQLLRRGRDRLREAS